MISQADRDSISNIAKKYDVRRVLLFGSNVVRDGNDIDLAVEGIKPHDFFTFYGELLFALSKPVDLIDLADVSILSNMVSREGVAIYG